MARIIENKYPIDLDNRKIVGFDFPLNADGVFNPTFETKEQIKANLINYLLTNKKERIFRPNFGSNLKSLLFENINDSTITDLQINIENSIREYFPMIEVKQIKFQNNPDRNEINFKLIYNINLFDIKDELNIILQ